MDDIHLDDIRPSLQTLSPGCGHIFWMSPPPLDAPGQRGHSLVEPQAEFAGLGHFLPEKPLNR